MTFKCEILQFVLLHGLTNESARTNSNLTFESHTSKSHILKYKLSYLTIERLGTDHLTNEYLNSEISHLKLTNYDELLGLTFESMVSHLK